MRGDAELTFGHKPKYLSYSAGPCLPAGPLYELLDMIREQFAKAIEPRVLREVRLRVAQGARDVLDVDRVLSRDRLVPEGAERLQVALQRHQIEPAPEFLHVHRFAVTLLQRQEVRDQLVQLAIGDVDIRVSEQRHQVVGVGSHTRVLEIDDI